VSPWARSLLGVGVGALTLAICHSVAGGQLCCDDLRLLVRLADQTPIRALFTPFNDHVIPVTIAITGALFRAAGVTPWPYFALLLGLHAVNAWLLYRLLAGTTRWPVVAALGAIVWATGPTAIQTLSWYNDLGWVLLTTCTLVLVSAAARAAATGVVVTASTAVGWSMLLLLGANAIAAGLGTATVLAAGLLWQRGSGLQLTPQARAIMALTPVVAIVIFAASSVIWPGPGHATLNLGTAIGSLHKDTGPALDFVWRLARAGSSRTIAGWVTPQSPARMSILAILGGAAVVAGVCGADRRGRPLTVLLLVVTAAAYAVVAGGRAPLELLLASVSMRSIDVSADLARYHYLPTALLLVPMLGAAGWVEARRRGAGSALIVAWCAVQVGAWATYQTGADLHAKSGSVITEVRRVLDDLVSRTPSGKDLYVGNMRLPPAAVLMMPPSDVPGWAAIYVITHPVDDPARRVHFVEPDRRVREAFGPPGSRRVGRLLTPPWADAGTPRACSSAQMHAIGALLAGLLRCESVPDARDSACTQQIERRYAGEVRKLVSRVPGCAPDMTIAADARRQAALGNLVLACGPDESPPPQPVSCVSRRRRWLAALVRTLSTCHAAAVERCGRPDDHACTDRALERWTRRTRGDSGCRLCIEDAQLGRFTDQFVTLLLDRAVPMPVEFGKAIYLGPGEEPSECNP
jgi:hypothetical protein